VNPSLDGLCRADHGDTLQKPAAVASAGDLSGRISGVAVRGQARGGGLAHGFGWRNVFFIAGRDCFVATQSSSPCFEAHSPDQAAARAGTAGGEDSRGFVDRPVQAGVSNHFARHVCHSAVH